MKIFRLWIRLLPKRSGSGSYWRSPRINSNSYIFFISIRFLPCSTTLHSQSTGRIRIRIKRSGSGSATLSPTHALAIHNPCHSLLKLYPNHAQTIPQPCPNHAQTIPKPYPNHTQTIPLPHPKSYPNHIPMLYPKPYPNHVP